MRDSDRAPSRRRWIVLGLWAALLLAFWLIARGRPGGAGAVLSGWLAALAGSPIALLLLTGLYLLRPLVLLPVTVLTVFCGFLLGVVGGGAFALLMSLVSATVAYLLARRLAPLQPPKGSLFARLRARSFEAVLTARLTFLPGDLVNYGAGAVRVPYLPFALATLLGGLPGLAVGVLAGAAIEGDFRFEGLQVDPVLIGASLGLLLLSLLASWLLRRGRVPGER
jgi:uncharacterized membrane protein YdjX (TVP38/TMEM64 family)